MDRCLVRFGHCGRTIYTFSPGKLHRDTEGAAPWSRCPLCHEPLSLRLLEAPVRVPTPFRDGHRSPCALLIASRLGAAALSEQSDSELHVGISNSQGKVFSYTACGLRQDAQGWEEVLCVPLIPAPTTARTRRSWDQQLETFSTSGSWTPERFLEEREFGSCCYGYALSFVNFLRRLEGHDPVTRSNFTHRYVLPQVEASSQYLHLHLHVSHHGYYITEQILPHILQYEQYDC